MGNEGVSWMSASASATPIGFDDAFGNVSIDYGYSYENFGLLCLYPFLLLLCDCGYAALRSTVDSADCQVGQQTLLS